jgi:hypothetical protein
MTAGAGRRSPGAFALLALLAGVVPGAAQTVAKDAGIERLFTQVRAAYSGERARDVVAYVESRWRLAGNPGFDESIARVAALLDSAGYLPEERAVAGARLTYRIERRPLREPAWQPLDASLTIVGQSAPLLRFATNRNMIAIRSHSTPATGIEADLVDVGRGRPEDFERVAVAGRLVMGESGIGALYREAVQRRGALGVMAWNMAAYLKPETNRRSISFSSIPSDSGRGSFGIMLSTEARDALRRALAAGPVRLRVVVNTRFVDAPEQTLVADVRGRVRPDERFVFSAHVQEPGANDNASGVGALAEIARVTASLLRGGAVDPVRSLTFVWGDEIVATRRYIAEDTARARGIRWGLSLDMVGEDTDRTGGTFLIEKMPDPSAIWTRGEDRHSEWGGSPLTEDRMLPHYFNDFAIQRCRDQAAVTGWVVNTNPFEGGSDHTPFLAAGKPGLLFWHFTDQYYHTDGDRIENVSARTLANVGICATVTALALVSADAARAQYVVAELERVALARLDVERRLSADMIAAGGNAEEAVRIVRAWTAWYRNAAATVADLEPAGVSAATRAAIAAATGRIEQAGASAEQRLRSRVRS